MERIGRAAHARQEKVHNNVGFALDGETVRTYPETDGLPWRVVVDAQVGPPDARLAQVSKSVAEAIARYGGDLVVQVA